MRVAVWRTLIQLLNNRFVSFLGPKSLLDKFACTSRRFIRCRRCLWCLLSPNTRSYVNDGRAIIVFLWSHLDVLHSILCGEQSQL